MRACIKQMHARIQQMRTRIPSLHARLLEMLRPMPAIRQVSPLVDVRTERLHFPFCFTRGAKPLGLVRLALTRAPSPEIAGPMRLVAELTSESPGGSVLVPQHHRGNRERDRALRLRRARLRVPNRDDMTAISKKGTLFRS